MLFHSVVVGSSFLSRVMLNAAAFLAVVERMNISVIEWVVVFFVFAYLAMIKPRLVLFVVGFVALVAVLVWGLA